MIEFLTKLELTLFIVAIVTGLAGEAYRRTWLQKPLGYLFIGSSILSVIVAITIVWNL